MRDGLLICLHFALAVLELPPIPRERHFWGRLATLQLIYSLAGLVFGLACVVAGTLPFFHSAAGCSRSGGGVVGVPSQRSGGAPRAVLFRRRLAVVLPARPAVRV